MRKTFKNEKGITLIALVITIIVLLILAGVALRMIAGNEGILTKAEKAVNETNIAGAKEQAEIMLAELSADYYEKKFVDKTESGNLVNYIKNALSTAKPTSNGEFSVSIDGSGNVSVTDKGGNPVVEGTLDESGKIIWDERINVDWQDKFEDAIANQEKYLQEAANLGQDITKNTTIGLSADGQVVNMDLWKYQYALDNYDYYDYSAESKAENGYMLNKGSYDVEGMEFLFNGAGYLGQDLENIIIPQYIKAPEDNSFIAVTALPYTFTSLDIENYPEIPKTVEDLWRTFRYCENLCNAIIFPGQVTKGTFYECDCLINVNISEGVTSIGEGAFFNCTNLSSINIPESVTSIGDSAFSGCTNLSEINIPESVTSIGDYTFSSCTSLSSINIPDSVTSIGRNALDGTAWYNSQPDGVVYAGKVLYAYKGTMPSNTTITLNEGTKGIADYAFSGCTNLSSINIPDSVTSIGTYAFSGCTSLSSINIPESVTSIGVSAFYGWTEEQTINCEILEANKPSGWNTKWDYYSFNTARKAKLNWGVSM